MQDELLTYYERELTFFRKMANEFAAKYPKIANRLKLEENRSLDPHVERLLQGVSFLTARIQRKLDDEFPEIVESLLNSIYPHYLAPIPAMAIAQFTPDPAQGKLTDGYTLARHTPLYSEPISGTPCRFRTCYPVTLWPLEITAARIGPPDSIPDWPEGAKAVLRIALNATGGTEFSEFQLDTLRFYLNGEPRIVNALYELIFNDVIRLELRSSDKKSEAHPIVLPVASVRQVGFEKDEGMLPYSKQSFQGYRLLQEYFTFPEKFFFFDITGLKPVSESGFSKDIELFFFLNKQPAQDFSVEKDNFLLGCAPIVNLFEQIAEPINLDRIHSEYQVIPDLRRQPATEVYAITEVTSTAPYLKEPHSYRPLYSYNHAFDQDKPNGFWVSRRKRSPKEKDTGTDVYISLVDLDSQPIRPDTKGNGKDIETLTVHTTCTNRDWPERLPFGNREGDFHLDGAAPITKIRCLAKPTTALRPPLGGSKQWRLLSHLSLNYLSLTGTEEGKTALQEILKLYDYKDREDTQQQIAGITRVDSERVVRRIGSENGGAFARGLNVTIEFDEEKFQGSGVFLLASVLERFLGLYVSVNSFSQLVATTKQRVASKKGPLKLWPPRAGEQVLL